MLVDPVPMERRSNSSGHDAGRNVSAFGSSVTGSVISLAYLMHELTQIDLHFSGNLSGKDGRKHSEYVATLGGNAGQSGVFKSMHSYILRT